MFLIVSEELTLDAHIRASFPLKDTAQLDLVSSAAESNFKIALEALQDLVDAQNVAEHHGGVFRNS